MRFKQLTLHGFKTFANRTDFLFDTGVTAVVGPNGSGKSNVADAVRWVMGENSFAALRVKRTEDLVFSGSNIRPRLGMAEVSMTLENLNPWQEPETEPSGNGNHEEANLDERAKTRVDPVTELLRTNPSEVTVGRRAYRDGENEYFLNGQRVRLRDILELLARWGLARQTYAVVGQGLIDQALSLRPEERRALFEEAAGIGLYQSKRQNALEKLEETRTNLLRVNDIVNEIAPRLPSLARQAERARNYDGVVDTLDDKLRLWYAFQWARAHEVAQDKAAREKSAREALGQRRTELQDLTTRLTQLRRRGQELRSQLAESRRARAALESNHAVRTRELAVHAERLRLTAQQHDEADGEFASLCAAHDAQVNEVSAAEAALEAERRKREALTGEIGSAESELAELERLAANAETQQRATEPQVRELAKNVAELKNVLGIYEEGLRRAAALSLQAEALNAFETQRAQAASAVDAARSRITSLRTALAVAERDVAGARAALAAARTAAAQLESQVAARSSRLDTLRGQVRALTDERDALQARADESARALVELEERVAPADAGLIESEKEQSELEERETLLRLRLQEFEDAHNNAVLDAERARSDISRLATEIEDDLASGRVVSEIKVGYAPAPNGENAELDTAVRDAAVVLDADLPGQLRLRMSDEVVALPVVSAVPEGLEKEIRKLRNQIKYMGTINPNAPREHDELKARHAFLTEQAQDAHHAIESLNRAVAELDEIMRRRFDETFKAINTEFGKFFTLLFDGGTARLELTEPEDFAQTGIDIIAKPPGKRAAHLAMLSGGERSLTAAALLFAILKVSPTPFCVLDEVDAMLDEANVGRFRDALKTLALDTQFIVITHNRATMESASAVFGITMSEDGVSQAMSLRLDRETASQAAA